MRQLWSTKWAFDTMILSTVIKEIELKCVNLAQKARVKHHGELLISHNFLTKSNGCNLLILHLPLNVVHPLGLVQLPHDECDCVVQKTYQLKSKSYSASSNCTSKLRQVLHQPLLLLHPLITLGLLSYGLVGNHVRYISAPLLIVLLH